MKNISQRGGFALVLALVVLTFLFAAVGGLAVSRQMWGFTSTKQLDRSTLDLVTRADSSMWFSDFRTALQQDGTLDFAASPVLLDTPAEFDYGVSGHSSLFDAVTPYPTYPTTVSSMAIPFLFDTSLTQATGMLGGFDPYWGLRSYVGGFGVQFSREMSESGRDLRVGRFDAGTTRLRAWMSVDGARQLLVGIRIFPVSVFTLFCAAPAAGVDSVVSLSDSWLMSSGLPYSYGGMSTASVGMGRIYVEGMVQPSSALTWGLPAVATEGMVSGGGSLGFVFPDYLGGGTASGLSYDSITFLQARYAVCKGMLATGADIPQRLMRPGMVRGGDLRWRARDFSDSAGLGGALDNAVAAKVRVSVPSGVVSLVAYDASAFNGGVAAERALFLSAWTVNMTTQEVIYSPPAGFYDGFLGLGGKPPLSVSVEVVDAMSQPLAGYKLRLRVPSVVGLSSSAVWQKLTVVSLSCPLVLEGGFNALGGDAGSMLVSPMVYVSHPAVFSPSARYAVNGVVVTEAYSPEEPFLSDGVYTNTVDLVGSLVVWRRLAAAPGTTLPVSLTPDVSYLSGAKLPVLVPAVSDLRVSNQDMSLYQIRAVEP